MEQLSNSQLTLDQLEPGAPAQHCDVCGKDAEWILRGDIGVPLKTYCRRHAFPKGRRRA